MMVLKNNQNNENKHIHKGYQDDPTRAKFFFLYLPEVFITYLPLCDTQLD